MKYLNARQVIMNTRILPFSSPEATIERVGGKGANLARLAQAGCPVPPGFFIPVEGYLEAARANGLEQRIRAALDGARLDDPAVLEQVSAQIRALFTAHIIPEGLARAVIAEWEALGEPAVAVRSSATAEDLPEMSFAGQQDTYLNVCGAEALLRAVADCWGSLWTARAIGYRQRQKVGQEGIALAVVVQQMVQSEASGVLFTANPLTGLRSQTVIDAALGLGEGLVSGMVEPDHYVVDRRAGAIVEKTLGAKALAVVSRAEGGTQVVATGAGRQALPDERILELAELGQRVADAWGAPQDIEWAWDDQRLHLLQTRAITSLYPVPAGLDENDLRAMFSFGAVQGMLDPLTPLGQDAMALVVGGAGRLFDLHYDERTQKILRPAGDRLWLDITTPVRNPVGRNVIRGALDFIEPSVVAHLLSVWDDPRLTPTTRRLRPATALRVARGLAPIVLRVPLFMAAPEKRSRLARARIETVLAMFRDRYAAVQGSPQEKLLARVAVLRSVGDIFILLGRTLIPGVATAMSMWTLARRIAAQLDRQEGGQQFSRLAMEIPRGAPGNVTTEMDLELWRVSRAIHADPASAELFSALPAEELARRWKAGALPAAAQSAIGDFLDVYGFRGLAEIDLGRPRWVDDPVHVMQVLGSYLQIKTEEAPDLQFERAARAGEAAVETLAQAARRLPHGWLKSRQVRFAGRRVRAAMGIREAPKFFAVRGIGLSRMALLESGEDFARLGILSQPDDIFYLRVGELEALAAGEQRDWAGLVHSRRQRYQREKERRQIPRLLLSDGRAFYEGVAANGAQGGIHGAPVSPGVVEGRVHVVLDPRGVQLAPGEILVCPGTDPSWTPLFLAAGGLVMEVGGMMTHGAVVAREYGIPAVVGVDRATERLQTGMRVRVDGSSGVVQVLETEFLPYNPS